MQKNNSAYIVAADVGGTHITTAVIHTHDWSILPGSMVRSHVDSSAPAKSILRAWTDTLTASSKRVEGGCPSIGIAMPGPFDYVNGISLMQNQDKYDALYQLNIRQELTATLSVTPAAIRFINDAAAFLQGEVFAGGHEGHRKILGITLGTGLGSAVWEQGGNAIDASLWNTPYQDGIMEEYLVTRWFVNTFHQATGIQVMGLKELLRLRPQHRIVDEILAEYSKHLLHFLSFFSDQQHSNTFIIGGNIAKAWPAIRSFSPKAFGKFSIHLSKLGENAALIGAAASFL